MPLVIIQGKPETTNEYMRLSTGQRGKYTHLETRAERNGVRDVFGADGQGRWELKVIKAPRVCSKERIHARKGRVNGG